jgi:hypothetical protein
LNVIILKVYFVLKADLLRNRKNKSGEHRKPVKDEISIYSYEISEVNGDLKIKNQTRKI